MIYIDDEDPDRPLEPSFPPRNVIIKRGVKAEELYDLITEVGRGKFGTVYKCREKATGLKLAAKFVPIPKREDRRNVEREVEIMNSLQHHLIIQLYAAYEYQKMMCVVLELIEGGELFDRVIDDDFVLTERVCTVFMRQVCEAMQFIHRNNILHLDLKPENILCLTKEGNRIKIIDFGLARKYDPDKKLQVLFGTPEFVAPEVVNFDCISYGTDMWSVGVICYVLLSGLSPFMGETDLETMANVTIAKYDFDDEAFNNVSPEALDFITKLLDKDRSSRMTATECLEHEWLQRRPRPPPPAPPKPAAVPMTIYTTVTPPSPTHEIDAEAKELETTKDNLRTFIERWEEHPNSPYVFDTGANLIAPLRDTRKDSVVSSRACSPSPCESISSVSEDNANSETASQVKEKEQNDEAEDTLPDILVNRGFRDYLQSFDRRNSDTSYILGRQPQHSGERVNLADEIRKLSDHLLMLAEINTKLGQENDEDKQTQQESTESTEVTASTRKTQKSSSERSIISQSNSTSVITDSIQEMDEETTSESTTKVSKLTVRLQTSKQTSNIESNGRSENKISEKTQRMINGFKQFSAIQEDEMNYEAGLGVPWPITNKRIKFKINQMSRDVPIGSPDTHQTFNLEETANTTKDCLLHLLEKYNEQRFRNRGRGRLQSISVDWNSSDNLECRSMSSINAFFQRHTTHGEKINKLRAQLEAKSKY